MLIESNYNPIVKQLLALKLKKEREKSNVFIAEGERFVKDIPKDWDIKMYIISQSFQENKNLNIFNAQTKIYTVTDNIFANISDTQNPQGVLAVCRQKKYTLSDILIREPHFLLLAEELQDPGNLGTIIRVADAAGVTGIILSKGTVDLYNPKVLRATMGSIFHMPIIQNANMKETIIELNQKNIKILGAHLNSSITPYSIDLKNSVAIIVGNEANGLSDDIAKLTDILVKLPMVGKAESLNVSMASGILLYEVLRQRQEVFHEN